MGGRTALRAAGQDHVRSVVGLAPWLPPGEPVAQLAGRRVLLAHGDRDRMTSAASTERFVAQLRAAGVPASFVTVRGEGYPMLRRAAAWHELAAGFLVGTLLHDADPSDAGQSSAGLSGSDQDRAGQSGHRTAPNYLREVIAGAARFTVHRADGTSQTATFDNDGNLATQVDGAGHTTSYSYDPLNRLSTVTDPLGRATSYGYDSAGNLTKQTNPTGTVTTTTYDNADEQTGESFSDGSTPAESWTYTADRLPATMSDGTGTTSYSYDGLGRLTSQTNGAGQTVSYGYDLVGQLTGLTYPNGSSITRSYDAAGRLASVTDWNNHTTTFSRDADGNVTSQAYGNGVSAAAFDATDAMTSTTDVAPGGTTLASLTYTRDANSQLASATASGLPGSNESYSYSQLEQLTGVNTGTYSYDAAAGNLTKLLDGTTLGYDNANEATSYTPAGGQPTSLQYDAGGDRTAGPGPSGASETYSYDQTGQLTRNTSTTAGGSVQPASNLIAAGEFHSLAVDSAGTVWAWGYNADGELGNGQTTSSTTPIKVTGAPPAAAITAGLISSVELTRTGTLSSWGNNADGQLGNGSTTSSSTPVTVSGLSNITQVAAGNYHVLALRSDGTVAAWGLNNASQLATVTITNRSTPVTVAGLSNVRGWPARLRRSLGGAQSRWHRVDLGLRKVRPAWPGPARLHGHTDQGGRPAGHHPDRSQRR